MAPKFDPSDVAHVSSRIGAILFGLQNTPTKLKYKSASRVDLEGRLGRSPKVVLRVGDDQRAFDGQMQFDMATDLDTGVELADKFYYFYAAADPSSPLELIPKISLNNPSVGPVGFASDAWAYGGAAYNDSNKDLLRFSQVGALFLPHVPRVADTKADPFDDDPSIVSVDLDTHIPRTAGCVLVQAHLTSQASATGLVRFYVDGLTDQYDFIRATAGSTDGQKPLTIPTPSAAIAAKTIGRKVEEVSGEINQYDLHVYGWVDEYLV